MLFVRLKVALQESVAHGQEVPSYTQFYTAFCGTKIQKRTSSACILISYLLVKRSSKKCSTRRSHSFALPLIRILTGAAVCKLGVAAGNYLRQSYNLATLTSKTL